MLFLILKLNFYLFSLSFRKFSLPFEIIRSRVIEITYHLGRRDKIGGKNLIFFEFIIRIFTNWESLEQSKLQHLICTESGELYRLSLINNPPVSYLRIFRTRKKMVIISRRGRGDSFLKTSPMNYADNLVARRMRE